MNDKQQETLKEQEDANQRAEQKAGEDVRHPPKKPSDSAIPTREEDTDASGDAYNGLGEDNHRSGD